LDAREVFTVRHELKEDVGLRRSRQLHVDDFVAAVADFLEHVGISDPFAVEENSLIDVRGAALHRIDRRRRGVAQILGSLALALDRNHAIARAREPLDVILFVLRTFFSDEFGLQRTFRTGERLQRPSVVTCAQRVNFVRSLGESTS